MTIDDLKTDGVERDVPWSTEGIPPEVIEEATRAVHDFFVAVAARAGHEANTSSAFWRRDLVESGRQRMLAMKHKRRAERAQATLERIGLVYGYIPLSLDPAQQPEDINE